ncbi:MAG: hypothetical protein L0Y71_05680 [Gemmataceae bacterium]|nr:hypothetical protein [Gemmataceae bacterium]
MSLLIGCPACGALFKGPELLAGRTVRCLKCNTSMVVPAGAAPVEAAPLPKPSPLPVADPLPIPGEPVPGESATAGLTALLAAGLGVAFVLVIAVLVVFLNPSAPIPIAHLSQQEGAPIAQTEEPTPSPPKPPPPKPPVEPAPAEPEAPPEPPPFNRAEQLAELEAKEKEVLAPLEKRHATNQATLQRLHTVEDDLFKKKLVPKVGARYGAFLRDLAAAVRQINKDTLSLVRKREELLQAKRKLIYDHPQPDDPALELYGSLLLTREEIGDLGKRTISSGSPRAAAQGHIVAAVSAGTIATPLYKETLMDPDDPDLAAVSYGVASYRGKKAADTPVHIFVHRWRGAWAVLELPGRASSVLIGPAPSNYRRSAK